MTGQHVKQTQTPSGLGGVGGKKGGRRVGSRHVTLPRSHSGEERSLSLGLWSATNSAGLLAVTEDKIVVLLFRKYPT